MGYFFEEFISQKDCEMYCNYIVKMLSFCCSEGDILIELTLKVTLYIRR